MYQNKYLITIDIGNTNTSFICWKLDSGKIYKQNIYPNNLIETDFFFRPLQKNSLLINKDKKSKIFILICSVNTEIEKKVKQILTKINPDLIIRDIEKKDVKIKINYHGDIGNDRIVAVFAVHKIYNKDAIIINMGTATTIDILKNNIFSGGVILPGIKIMLESLIQNTSKIKLKKLQFPKHIEGKNTSECVSSGIYFGNLFMLNNFISTFKNELKKPVVVISGGNSKYFLNRLCSKTIYLPKLIHIGLLEIFKTL